MWIPVVDDSRVAGTSPVDECVIEAILALVPESLLADVAFVWIRGLPSDPPFDKLVVAFRVDAEVENRLAALIRDGEGTVLEIYAENVRGGLTDAWLREEWGMEPGGLSLSTTEKLEVTLFALLAHFGIRRGLTDEAKTLMQRIGRVIFRAAVRAALTGLARTYPGITFGDVSPSIPDGPAAGRAPIDDREVAGTDYEQLLRRLLGLDEPGEQDRNASLPPP